MSFLRRIASLLVVAPLAACGGGSDGDRYGATTDPPAPPSADATALTCPEGRFRLRGELAARNVSLDEPIDSIAHAAPTDAQPGVVTITLEGGRGHVTLEYSGEPGDGKNLPARMVVALKLATSLNASNCASEPMQSTLKITTLETLSGGLTGLRLRSSATGDCKAALLDGGVEGCFQE